MTNSLPADPCTTTANATTATSVHGSEWATTPPEPAETGRSDPSPSSHAPAVGISPATTHRRLRTGDYAPATTGALEVSVIFDTRVADRRSRPQPLALRLRHHAAAPSDTIVSEDGQLHLRCPRVVGHLRCSSRRSSESSAVARAATSDPRASCMRRSLAHLFEQNCECAPEVMAVGSCSPVTRRCPSMHSSISGMRCQLEMQRGTVYPV